MAFPGRTTATEMAKICTLTAGLDTSMSIDIANDLVTEVLAGLTKKDVNNNDVAYFSSHTLFLIENLLACHFYCLNDPRGRRERVGVLTFEAQSKVDVGLKVTHYGQQALILDRSGNLAALEKQAETGKAAKFQARTIWTGKSYSRWAEWPGTVGRRWFTTLVPD